MSKNTKSRALMGTIAIACSMLAADAHATMEITEWMYNGNGGEFVEFTNMGLTPIDMTGWSYDDDSRLPGVFSLSGFGVVGVGESVVITESTESAFRSAWALTPSVKVLGGYTNNLGRNDEINLFNASSALVDRLTYGDTAFPGTIRTQNFSGNPNSVAALVPQTVTTNWVLASTGDVFGSYASTSGDIGNPGDFVFAPIPEPSTYAMVMAGLALLGFVARRRA